MYATHIILSHFDKRKICKICNIILLQSSFKIIFITSDSNSEVCNLAFLNFYSKLILLINKKNEQFKMYENNMRIGNCVFNKTFDRRGTMPL